MSEFKHQIEKAARRQQVVLLGLGVILLGAVLASAVFLFLMKVTSVRIAPLDAAQAAEIQVDDGIGFYVQGSLFSLSRYPKITAKSPGFEELPRIIDPEEEGKTLNLQMVPLPGKLDLNVANLTEPVTWYLNDQMYPPVQNFEATLDAGRFDLRIEHPYFQPLETELELARGETLTQSFELKPAMGSLTLNVTPPDATVMFNGEIVQTIPAEFEVPAGLYDVKITKQGFAPIVDQIDITFSNSQVDRHYRLQQKPAFVTASVDPSGGRLTVNGKSVRAGSDIQLAPNQKYYVRYEKDGYGYQEQEVTLRADERKKVAFDLKLRIGEVRIQADPPATLMINGQPHGTTPATLRLPAISHEITLQKQGYETVKKVFRPTPARVTTISVTLKTNEEATLASAKPTYKNLANMNMILFKPTDILMGAPRHEKGQRANEFLRQITLKRHFYIAQTEVTEKQFSQFRRINKAGPDFPVTNIDWSEAAQYCNWLSEREELPPFYRFNGARYAGFDPASTGYRLPSEAEWEWLARKAKRKQQTIFPWGDEAVIPKGAGNIADEAANGKTKFYVPGYVDGYAGVAPVKSFQKDQAGLYDLFGNVSEWVHDYYTLVPPLKTQTFKDPLGDQTGQKHMTKGSNWASGTLTELRPAYRASASEGSDKIGFRIARYLYEDVQ